MLLLLAVFHQLHGHVPWGWRCCDSSCSPEAAAGEQLLRGWHGQRLSVRESWPGQRLSVRESWSVELVGRRRRSSFCMPAAALDCCLCAFHCITHSLRSQLLLANALLPSWAEYIHMCCWGKKFARKIKGSSRNYLDHFLQEAIREVFMKWEQGPLQQTDFGPAVVTQISENNRSFKAGRSTDTCLQLTLCLAMIHKSALVQSLGPSMDSFACLD